MINNLCCQVKAGKWQRRREGCRSKLMAARHLQALWSPPPLLLSKTCKGRGGGGIMPRLLTSDARKENSLWQEQAGLLVWACARAQSPHPAHLRVRPDKPKRLWPLCHYTSNSYLVFFWMSIYTFNVSLTNYNPSGAESRKPAAPRKPPVWNQAGKQRMPARRPLAGKELFVNPFYS